MANYRQIHVSIWKDAWFLELDTDEKLFFVYLFSNELASLSGIYKLPLRVMAFETGLSLDFVKAALNKFEKADKVYFEDGIVWVKNLRKYNKGGATVDKRIVADIQEIPYCKLKIRYMDFYYPDIPYQYTIDRVFYEMKMNEMKCSEMKMNEEGIVQEIKESAKNSAATPSSFIPPASSLPTMIIYPTNAREASENKEIRTFKGVSGVFPGIDDYKVVIDTILFLRKSHPDESDLQSYLLPFWLAWDGRKTRGGLPFKKTNPTWLTEWAVNNNIPPVFEDKSYQSKPTLISKPTPSSYPPAWTPEEFEAAMAVAGTGV